MNAICISLGGSVISNRDGLDLNYLQAFAKALSQINKKFVVVTGGGYTSKQYVTALRKVSSNEFYLDEAGIKAGELNAFLLKCVFDSVASGVADICDNLTYLKSAVEKGRVVITHGQLPGITTDAVAVLACEAIGGRIVINISSVSHIYDRPPEEKGARKLRSLGYDELIKLADRFDTRAARSNFIFDLVACKFAKRSKIELRFVGDDIETLKKAINGRNYEGSIVR